MACKVLAIDDSLTLRKFIANSLAKNSRDYEVVTAKDGQEGLDLALSEQPELILLDFILPDMRGDEVCRRLLEDPATADLPVVLMSSNSAEIKRAEADFQNIVKSIAKPFTPELLNTTVRYVLRERALAAGNGAQEAPVPVATTAAVPRSKGIVFTGGTNYFSLVSALRAIEAESLTGVLRVFAGPQPIELYTANGRPGLIAFKDSVGYLGDAAYAFTPEQEEVLEGARRDQDNTGSPMFVGLAKAGLVSPEEAADICRDHGYRVFAKAWTASNIRFEFDALTALPEFAILLPSTPISTDEWCMETLRYVGEEALSAQAWGDLSGIPVYTRRGYERIQLIPLNDAEISFVMQINGSSSLTEIADSLEITPEDAQQLLFRFLSLEIFDYWPAAALRGE